jgi:hypothetical protein
MIHTSVGLVGLVPPHADVVVVVAAVVVDCGRDVVSVVVDCSGCLVVCFDVEGVSVT